jgi:hypothetical protein
MNISQICHDMSIGFLTNRERTSLSKVERRPPSRFLIPLHALPFGTHILDRIIAVRGALIRLLLNKLVRFPNLVTKALLRTR